MSLRTLPERAELPVILDVLLVDEPSLYGIEASNGQVRVARLDGNQHRAAKTRNSTSAGSPLC
jgi:hypothetical protein